MTRPRDKRPWPRRLPWLAALTLLPLLARGDVVYRWQDADGVVHISSSQPPAGVRAERIEVRASSGAKSGTASRKAAGSVPSTKATPAQVAERESVLGNLRNRECVIALEALDRLTSGAQPTSAAEIRRLEQTADLNCSKDPARRRQQEDMAAKLRVANSPACVGARNELALMQEAGAKVSREQVKAQQDFVTQYCTPPVR